MSEILELGLVNAALAAILAAIVFGVTQVWRNPHIAHVLWVLVLVKLVTPPLVEVPIPFGEGWYTQELSSTVGAGLKISELNSVPAETELSGMAQESANPFPLVEKQPPERRAEPVANSVSVAGTSVARTSSRFWPFWVGIVWLSGSFLWGLTACIRIVRFHNKLRETDGACEALERVGETVARKLGLKRFPELLVTNGHLGPMVWPTSRLSLTIPAACWNGTTTHRRFSTTSEVSHA